MSFSPVFLKPIKDLLYVYLFKYLKLPGFTNSLLKRYNTNLLLLCLSFTIIRLSFQIFNLFPQLLLLTKLYYFTNHGLRLFILNF